jgi:DNA repair/transcription protein MET18/MMS19
LQFVAQHFELGTLSKELFDIASCYFPITFNPPKNDPYGVTKEGLVGGLRASMHAHPSFAKGCLELLLDKASSTVNDTKVE